MGTSSRLLMSLRVMSLCSVTVKVTSRYHTLYAPSLNGAHTSVCNVIAWEVSTRCTLAGCWVVLVCTQVSKTNFSGCMLAFTPFDGFLSMLSNLLYWHVPSSHITCHFWSVHRFQRILQFVADKIEFFMTFVYWSNYIGGVEAVALFQKVFPRHSSFFLVHEDVCHFQYQSSDAVIIKSWARGCVKW